MKKRIWIVFALAMIAASVAAEATPLSPKHYYDWLNGYSGEALAVYRGTTKTIDPKKLATEYERSMKNDGLSIVGYCNKLSKQERFLLCSALGEYDVEDGEVYSVGAIAEQSKCGLTTVVVIKDNGNNFDWYGGFYTATGEQ